MPLRAAMVLARSRSWDEIRMVMGLVALMAAVPRFPHHIESASMVLSNIKDRSPQY
jgi:hypothetical protein